MILKIIVCTVILLVVLVVGFVAVLCSILGGKSQAEEEIIKRFEQLEMDGQHSL